MSPATRAGLHDRATVHANTSSMFHSGHRIPAARPQKSEILSGPHLTPGNHSAQWTPIKAATTPDGGCPKLRTSCSPNTGILVFIAIRSTPLVTGINHYNLVADRDLLDDLREFYTTIVGLTPGPRPPFKRFGYWCVTGYREIHIQSANFPPNRDARLESRLVPRGQ
jgi:hypothetical protein